VHCAPSVEDVFHVHLTAPLAGRVCQTARGRHGMWQTRLASGAAKERGPISLRRDQDQPGRNAATQRNSPTGQKRKAESGDGKRFSGFPLSAFRFDVSPARPDRHQFSLQKSRSCLWTGSDHPLCQRCPRPKPLLPFSARKCVCVHPVSFEVANRSLGRFDRKLYWTV